MKNTFIKACLLIGLLIISGWSLFGQGSTSSRITGQVFSGAEELIGATVIAVHEPTGSRYGTATNSAGLFTLNNLNVGGPYTITVSYTGFETVELKNISLALGQTATYNIEMKESAQLIDEIVVTAGGLFDGNRTGSETKVTEEAITNIPTTDRGLRDYLRLTPQANVSNNGAVNSGGISFTGVNNRFNAIFIDGAVNNDVFGLANSGTNGGQAGISPISPDALEEIQVVLAPYDVTLGGFAGGGINAVTRSGTNEFIGSAYYFFRNEQLAGKTPTNNPEAERTRLAPFTARTFGARLGGPIVENKLFFFANVEIQRDELPRPFIASDYIGDATVNDLEAIRQKLLDDFGYDPGGYENNPQTTDGEKFLAKLDWNINENHKLSFRHSYTKGTTEIHPAPSSTEVVFGNVGYIFPSTTNSTALELKSIFGQKTSNNLILGLTTVRDERDILGDPFPQIIMPDGNAQVVVGTDNFSYSNVVNQDVFTLTNNFNYYKGIHSWTFGTHNEFFTIENLFTIFSTPRYEYFFNGVNRFLAGENADLLLFGHEQLAPGQSRIRLADEASNLGPTFNALQMAFYAQDEIQFSKDFKLTAGLRLDIPIFLEDPPLNNQQFNENTVPLIGAFYDLKGARASNTPNTQLLLSPRIGFNWDVSGNRSTQLRGGAGIFTSRVPWVWPGGMYIRNGLNSAFNVRVGVGEQEIYGDPEQWIDNLTSSASPTGDVDLFTEDFKYPQIFRSSLALDKKLPWDLSGSVELTYTKTLNNIDVKNVNVKPSKANFSGADDRPMVDFSDPVDPTYTNITLVDNTNKGYTFNVSAQLSKSFSPDLIASLAYSFTRADALFDGSGFINNTNWLNVLSVQGNNNPMVARSVFDAASRLTAFLSYKANYSKVANTTFSLFLTAQSGSPYTYVYNNPISDVSQSLDINDMIYVPASQSEINLVDLTDGSGNVIATAAEQWAALDAFIERDDYLSERRGDYVEPNQIRTPFEAVLDFKIIQEFKLTTANGKDHRFQVSLDIFNFTNWLNKDWGRRYFVPDNRFPLITANLNDQDVPEFNFTDPGDPYNIVQSGTYSARWSGQFGLRYLFD